METSIETVVGTKRARRYDVDWLRTLALGLLIIYHIVISFQPWARYIWFMGNQDSIESLWIGMSLINVWRIPLLFLISGMGVRFAMERRNWLELLKDRTVRILLPLVFGYFFIGPICLYFVVQFYYHDAVYEPGMWHLWFLANIFIYVLVLLPVFVWFRQRPNNPVLRIFRSAAQIPLGLSLFIIPIVAEAIILKPGDDYVTYADTAHGFWLGMVCFLVGFVFVSMGDSFWRGIKGIRWPALALAFGLFLARMWPVETGNLQDALSGLESASWMLAILGFGSVYLNHDSALLRYVSAAVYPVYILHLPIQFMLSYYILPLELAAGLKLALLLVGTFGIAMILYEIIRRIKWIRPLFGIKFNNEKRQLAAVETP